MKLAGIALATADMMRREFIALTGASVTRPFVALAQQAGRTYRLGCLLPTPRGDNPINIVFFDELRVFVAC
jgi:putative tryptophan/tyrosine transport system substrate-binding protein